MQLVDEIIELLSASTPNVQNALFKAQVLAHRLGEQELKRWVDFELKGYSDSSDVPPYRVLDVTVMGDVSNGAYRYTNHPLPTRKVDERLRKRLLVTNLTQSIAVVERWSKSESDLSIVIPPELYSALSKGLGNGYTVERAWGKHSDGAMVQVLVEVRSRLLDLALQLSDRIPQKADATSIRELAKGFAVSEIFKNVVFGNNTTIVVGAGSIHGVTNSIVTNDFDTLAAVLKQQHVSDEDVRSLKDAIDGDANSDSPAKGIGPRVSRWRDAMMTKAGSAAWDVSTAAAGNLLSAALAAYYGIGS